MKSSTVPSPTRAHRTPRASWLATLGFAALVACSSTDASGPEGETTEASRQEAPQQEALFPGTTPDEVRVAKVQTGSGPEDYAIADIAVHGDEYVLEGDILIGKDQLTFLDPNNERPMAELLAATFTRHLQWPDGVIPYTLNTVAVPSVVTDAIREWESKTPIRFVRRTTQRDYLVFYGGIRQCGAGLGRTGGSQIVYIGSCKPSSVIHEIGHTIGLLHEHTRSDRDRYVEIRSQNIRAGSEHNFTIRSNSTNYGVFDFSSMMLYGPHLFSKNGQPTMVRRSNGASNWSELPTRLSAGDVRAVRQMYGAGPP